MGISEGEQSVYVSGYVPPMKIVFGSKCDPTSFEPSGGSINVGHPAIAQWLERHPRVAFRLLRLLRKI